MDTLWDSVMDGADRTTKFRHRILDMGGVHINRIRTVNPAVSNDRPSLSAPESSALKEAE
jgi:hypothetical protein